MVGIFTTDANLVIGSWDEWLAQITGIPARAARGQSLISLFPDLESRGMLERFERVVREDAVEILAPAFHHYLFECSTAGSSKYFETMQQRVTIAPLRENGVVVGTIVTVEDVTSRLDRERDLSERLSSADEGVRISAAGELAEQEALESSEPLIGGLGDESWRVRRLAVDGLARHGGQAIVRSLLKVLREEHRDLSVLNSALQVLALSDVDSIAPLIECLNDSDADLRIYSAHALGEQHDPRAIPALLRALQDPDVNVRYHSIEALGTLHAVESTDALLSIVESGDFYLAFPALDALTKIGDSRVAPRLVPMLEDQMLRVPAAEALGELGDEETIAPLVNLLNHAGAPAPVLSQALATIYDRYDSSYDEGGYIADLVSSSISASGAQNLLESLDETSDSGLRALALVLGWTGGEAAERALTRLLGKPTARKEVIEALVRYGSRVTELLIEQLDAEDLETRQAATIALGRIGDTHAVPALVRVLVADEDLIIPAAGALARIGDRRALDGLLNLVGHNQPAVRQAAIAAINSIGHPEMADRALSLLNDPDARVRESGVQIAGYFGFEQCIDLLFELCRDPEENVRRAAIEHLPYLDDDRAAPILSDAVQTGTPKIRASAAKAFGQIESSNALSCLLAALDDEDQWVRYFAARSIGQHQYVECVIDLARLAREDPANHVRIAAIESLAKIGGARAVAILASLADSKNIDLASAAIGGLGLIKHPDGLPPLLAVLRENDSELRISAIRALGNRGGAEAVDALQWVAAAATDEHVVQAAIDALSGLETPEAIETLINLTSDSTKREACLDALAAQGKEHIKFIGNGLTHPKPVVRRAVVTALGRMKQPAATELLRGALEDTDASVRTSAANAFAHLSTRNAERKLVAMARSDPDPGVRRAAQRALRK